MHRQRRSPRPPLRQATAGASSRAGRLERGHEHHRRVQQLGRAHGELVEQVNLSTGGFTPIVSGLDSPHGEAFFPIGVPEPRSWALMILG
ncbi:MAG TPA: hypothetical protein VH353_15835, partial [Caulobacteraceae bacterium]|nr:hypothetical protein [Caulobacteraceae bacterium]